MSAGVDGQKAEGLAAETRCEQGLRQRDGWSYGGVGNPRGGGQLTLKKLPESAGFHGDEDA